MNAHIRSMWPRLPSCAIAGAAALAFGVGTAAADTLVFPAEYMTIQEAIDDAQHGDHVVIEPGTYNEVFNFMGKAITVRSVDPDDPGIVAATILDGRMLAAPVVTSNSGEGPDTVLDGLTIQMGEGVIPRGTDHRVGGGMYVQAGSPTVMHCVFQNNVAGCGAGLFSDGGSPRIISTMFRQNRAILPDPELGLGGGVYAARGNVEFIDCTFERNIADIGGGLRIGDASDATGEWSVPLISGCIFLRNLGLVRGGGIDCSPSTTVSEASSIRIVGSVFEDNVADFGAGLNHHTGLAEVLFSRFTLNMATSVGGGIHVNFNALLNVVGCEFSRNCADGFEGNAGGAVGSSCGQMYFSNSTFAGNVAKFGAAVWSCASTDTHIGNCTFFQNTATVAGGAFRSEGEPPFNTIANSILWGNTPDQISGPVTVEYSDVQDWIGGAGNVSIAPEFRSADDLRLRSGSACVDTGSRYWVLPDHADVDEDGDTHELIPLDMVGNPRFVDDPEQGDPLPLDPPVDMGAYEFCRADIDFDGAVGIDDLVDVIVAWDTVDPDADTNADGIVNVDDLVSVLLNWGPCG